MAHLNFLQQSQQYQQQPGFNGSNTSINFPHGYFPSYPKLELNALGWNPMYPYPSLEHVPSGSFFFNLPS